MTSEVWMDEDGTLYAVVRCTLGWLAVDLNDSGTCGSVKATKAECTDGLLKTRYTVTKGTT